MAAEACVEFDMGLSPIMIVFSHVGFNFVKRVILMCLEVYCHVSISIY